jgi:hypothetical protein
LPSPQLRLRNIRVKRDSERSTEALIFGGWSFFDLDD